MAKHGRIAANGRFHLRYEVTGAGKVWVDRCMKHEAALIKAASSA